MREIRHTISIYFQNLIPYKEASFGRRRLYNTMKTTGIITCIYMKVILISIKKQLVKWMQNTILQVH